MNSYYECVTMVIVIGICQLSPLLSCAFYCFSNLDVKVYSYSFSLFKSLTMYLWKKDKDL